MKKAIFFDIDNTLLDFDACSEVAIRLGFEERGLVWRHELYATFVRVNNSLWEALERGELTQEGLYAVRFDRVFEAMGIACDGADFERSFRVRLHDLAIPMAGAAELLLSLKERFRLFAASNGPHEQQVNRLRSAGLLGSFEEVFTSERMGHSKPGREFFDECFALLPGLTPADCVMVGDSLTADIAGALDYGMEAIWLNLSGAPAPEEYPGLLCAADLEEIGALLRGED